MFWLCGGLVVLLDRLTKAYVMAHFMLHESQEVLPGVLSLCYVQNRGAAFSILSGQRWLLLLLAAVTIGGILWYRHQHPFNRQVDMALGLVIGGAVGNMIDRFFWGYVTDFISVGWWPVFNVADIAIVCGGVVVALMVFRSEKKGHGNGYDRKTK